MMYPFMQLEDNTKIVHSEILDDGKIKVYIEKPIENGFQSATAHTVSIGKVFTSKKAVRIALNREL